jgi:ribosomal protein S24E
MMKMEVRGQRKNPLMKREEVMISVDHSGKATPQRAELIEEVAKKLKASKDLIIVDKIFSASGRSESSVKVLVYKKKEDIPKGKLDKMGAKLEKTAKKKGAQAAEKPAEEKPGKPEEVPTVPAGKEGKD